MAGRIWRMFNNPLLLSAFDDNRARFLFLKKKPPFQAASFTIVDRLV